MKRNPRQSFIFWVWYGQLQTWTVFPDLVEHSLFIATGPYLSNVVTLPDISCNIIVRPFAVQKSVRMLYACSQTGNDKSSKNQLCPKVVVFVFSVLVKYQIYE